MDFIITYYIYEHIIGGVTLDDIIVQLVYQYGDQLHRYAYHMTRNEDDAQDIIQEVFVKLLNVKDYNNIKNISAYLYSMTYNCTVDFIKNRDKLGIFNLFLNRSLKSAEDEFLDKNIDSVIEDALNKLNPEERTVFLLRTLEEMDYSTIFSIMNINEVTLRKKYERSRKKIKKYLKGRMEGYHEHELTRSL